MADETDSKPTEPKPKAPKTLAEKLKASQDQTWQEWFAALKAEGVTLANVRVLLPPMTEEAKAFRDEMLQARREEQERLKALWETQKKANN